MENPYLSSHEIMAANRGSIETTAAYLSIDNIPDYAVMSYQPTEHEVFSQIKYGSFEAGYGNLNEIRQDLLGMPFEFYVPQPGLIPMSSGSSAAPKQQEVVEALPDKILKEIEKEIEKAQETLEHKKVKVTVEETILVKRKRSVTFEQTKRTGKTKQLR